MNRLSLTETVLATVTLLTALPLAQLPTARANDVILSVDPARSSLKLALTDPNNGDWVAQLAGSDLTTVSGHFLTDFDPLEEGGPSSITFQGGHGYLAYANTAGGANLGPWGAPANFGLKTVDDSVELSFQNTVWDWFSNPQALAAGSFDSNNLSFVVLSGSYSGQPTAAVPPAPPTEDFTGFSDHINGGGATTLAETSPGSGNWELTIQATYTVGLAQDVTATFSGTIVATGQFGADNLARVVPFETGDVSVLGGKAQPGGVTALFDEQSGGGGTFSAQQIPLSGLSVQAIAAAEKNSVFAASTGDLSVDPQIWNVEFTGDLDGPLTLIFSYDPAKLPAGTDESLLGIWHFNSGLGKWQFGGTVDTTAHTITYVTESFSPFIVGVAVPEPASGVLALLGLSGLAAMIRRRKRDRQGR